MDKYLNEFTKLGEKENMKIYLFIHLCFSLSSLIANFSLYKEH